MLEQLIAWQLQLMSLQLQLLRPAYAAEISLPQYAEKVAVEHHLNVEHFKYVIQCESGWDPQIVSPRNKDGTYDKGLVQINDAWNFTDKQRFDPIFSIDFMAEQWEQNHYTYWNCWKDKYGKAKG